MAEVSENYADQFARCIVERGAMLDRLRAIGPEIRDAMDRANNLMMDTDETKFEVGLGYIWDALRAALDLIEEAEKSQQGTQSIALQIENECDADD